MSGIPRKKPVDFPTRRLEAFDASWRTRVAPSGLTLLHMPLTHTDQFYLGVMIGAGSRLETETEMGISHFLEHMMFRGSDRFPEFTRLAEAFEWLGGDWNAATGNEHTEYWYSGTRHTAPEVIELFADFLEKPKLTDIEVERHIIERELDGETNDHGHSTDIDLHIANLLWPGSTMARPILGSRETLARIDVAALQAYRDRLYTPPNIAVCAVGGDESMIEDLQRHFATHRTSVGAASKNAYPPLPAFNGPAVKWVEHSDNEYEIKLSFLCGGEWSAEAQSYDLLTRILSDGFCSRLARRLREELGLVYDINAHTSLFSSGGTIDIHASCAQDQLDEYLRELFSLLADLVKTGPTADELERAIVRSIVDIDLSAGQPEAIGGKLAWSTLCGRRLSLVAERQRYTSVTVEGMAAMIRRVMRPENAALAALGPADKDIEKRMRKALVQGLGG